MVTKKKLCSKTKKKKKRKEEKSSCRRQASKSQKPPSQNPPRRWPVCRRRRGSSRCGASRPPAPASSARSTQPCRPDSTTPAVGSSPVPRAAAPQGTSLTSAAAGDPERSVPRTTGASRRGNSRGGWGGGGSSPATPRRGSRSPATARGGCARTCGMRKGSPWRGGGDSSCLSAHRGGELQS